MMIIIIASKVDIYNPIIKKKKKKKLIAYYPSLIIEPVNG